MSHPSKSSIALRQLTGLSTVALWLLVGSPGAAQLGTDQNLDIRQIDFGDAEEVSDRFGTALASGDFDGDGWADLAIGTPDENIGGLVDAGAVYVVYGSPFGLGLGPYQTFHQDSANMMDVAEAGDRFGAALAAADINGDGRDDLAIGVPGEDSGGAAGAGAVHVVYGSPSGLTALEDLPDAREDEVWSQDDSALPGTAEAGDAFGSALALGDFDGDGYFDLAIGTPGENADTGETAVLYGWFAGLFPSGEVWDWGVSGSDGDRFGSALATGPFFGSSTDYLFVGVPFGDSGMSAVDVGHVVIFQSSPDEGLVFRLGSVSFGSFGEGSQGGVPLASGNFDGVGDTEIAVGVSRALADNVGAVEVLADGLVGSSFRQGVDGTLEASEPFDQYGEALATGDFDGDGFTDLATGVPGENLYDGSPGLRLDAGVVHTHYGSAAGLSTAGNQVWNLDTPGIDYGASANDNFGGALAAGDFNADGADDLAIGIPGADVGASSAGLVLILEGFPTAIFSDGFESGNTAAWGAP